MQKHLLVLSFLAITVQASAFSFQDQLEARNTHWKSNRTLLVADKAKVFENDGAFVQAHFAAVEVVLLNADVSKLSPAQLEARYRNIQVLHEYAARGIFPANHCTYSTPVFIDEFNTHCAVGHLMQQSGFDAMAVRIASRNNYVHAIDINDPEIYAWQEASGFTMEELALIQPSYSAPPEQFEQQYACTTVYFQTYAWTTAIYDPNAKKAAEPEKYVWYSGECENGVLNGKWEQYHAANQIWIRGYFKNGLKDGEWIYFNHAYNQIDPTIQKKENWTEGKLNGPYTSYDYTGKINAEGAYKNGLKEGAWKTWGNGSLSGVENYVAGKLHGDKIQYYMRIDSSEVKKYQHDVYEHGILQSRKIFTQSGALTSQLDLTVSGRHLFTQFTNMGKIFMTGQIMLSDHVDSLENMMYPNLPKTPHQYEVQEKVGRWSYYPAYGHYMLTMYGYSITNHDSAHIYYSAVKRKINYYEGFTDSINAVVLFWKNGVKPCNDSIVFNKLEPDHRNSYQYYPTPITESWKFENGHMTQHSGIPVNGSGNFTFNYRDGKLTQGYIMYPNGNYHRTWSLSSATNPPILYYQEVDTKQRLMMKGPILDTTTRDGQWEFYDTTGAVIAKGKYVNGLKEGKWMETNADGTVWEGEYKNGKKKGTWLNNSRDGVLIRREMF